MTRRFLTDWFRPRRRPIRNTRPDGHCRLLVESLESREVPTVNLLSIPSQSIPNNEPIFIPVTTSTAPNGAVNFGVTSSNSAVTASVVTGDETLKLTVSGTDSSGNAFTGTLTMLLFQNEAPAITNRIIQLADSGFYNATQFFRVLPGFVIQGGTATNTGTSGQAALPDEFNPNYTFVSQGVVAMANAGPDDNDAQFFITDPSASYSARQSLETELNFGYSIVGILTSGFDTYAKIIGTTTTTNGQGENSQPTNPITITSASIINDTANAVVELTTTSGFTGTSSIQVTGTDANGPQSESFTVTGAADTATSRPFLGTLGNQTTIEGSPISFTIPSTDVDGNPVTYVVRGQGFTGTPANATATVTAAGLVTITPNAGFTGTINFSVGVTDGLTVYPGGQVYDSRELSLAVNAPTTPVFTSGTSTTFTEGTAGSFTVTASGAPTPTLTENSSDVLPPGVTFNAATGILSGTPTAGGTYTLNFTATNSASSASQVFTLVVDQPPAFTSATSTTFTAGTAGTFTLTSTGTPAASYSEASSDVLPQGVTFNPSTGVLSGTPASTSGGTYTLNFTASNGVGTAATQTFTLTVNAAPVFTSVTSISFATGIASTFNVTASGFPLPTFSESSSDQLPAGVAFDAATGVLSGTPSSLSLGTYNLNFTATNGIGSPVTQAFVLTVGEPQPPTFTNATSTTFVVGTAGSFSLAAEGAPTPTFTEASTDKLPSGVTFNSATGVLSGTPAVGSGGTYTLNFTAANGVSPAATQTVTLTVNQAPIIGSAASTTFTEGTAGTFTVTATGSPTPTITESSTDTLPSGVTFNSSDGVLSGTPAKGAAGTYTLHFTASNGIGTASTQTFTLTVAASVGPITATGSPVGSPPMVTAKGSDGKVLFSELVFPASFMGGVTTVVGDVMGDGNQEIVVAPGFGGGPDLVVLNGTTGAVLFEEEVFETTFRGGLSLQLSDVDGSGHDEIMVGAGNTGGPRVEMINVPTNQVLLNIFAGNPNTRGGVSLAISDLIAGGKFYIVAGAGPGNGPVVSIYDATDGTYIGNFFAGPVDDRNGIQIAVGSPNPTTNIRYIEVAPYSAPPGTDQHDYDPTQYMNLE